MMMMMRPLRPAWQVLGLDTLQTKDVRETHKLVVNHIASVRRIRNLEEATIVLSLESNLAFEAQHIVHTLQAANLRKWVALQEGAGSTLGWLTVCPEQAPNPCLNCTPLTPPFLPSALDHRRTSGKRRVTTRFSSLNTHPISPPHTCHFLTFIAPCAPTPAVNVLSASRRTARGEHITVCRILYDHRQAGRGGPSA